MNSRWDESGEIVAELGASSENSNGGLPISVLPLASTAPPSPSLSVWEEEMWRVEGAEACTLMVRKGSNKSPLMWGVLELSLAEHVCQWQKTLTTSN